MYDIEQVIWFLNQHRVTCKNCLPEHLFPLSFSNRRFFHNCSLCQSHIETLYNSYTYLICNLLVVYPLYFHFQVVVDIITRYPYKTEYIYSFKCKFVFVLKMYEIYVTERLTNNESINSMNCISRFQFDLDRFRILHRNNKIMI